MITILGLGPGRYDQLTLRAARALESADIVLLRTARHPTVHEFPAVVHWISFDEFYESGDSFETVYDRIVEQVLEQSRAFDRVVYAVPGDPSLGEDTVRRLAARCQTDGEPYELLGGVSFLSPVLAATVGSASDHLQVLNALDLPDFNPMLPAVVYQVYDRTVASNVKVELLRLYPASHQVTIVRQTATGPMAEQVNLAELDQRGTFDHLTSLHLSAVLPEQAGSSPFGLRAIVHRLRAPGGCPWDREQTHASLAKYILEEAYEVAEAIDDADPHNLREELGDLLLQVYLHAEIAQESGDFDLTDVSRGLSEKLIRRHPHVFLGLAVASTAEVERNWERLKQSEKIERSSALDGIPRSLPALRRAQDVQRKMSQAGFDWYGDDAAWIKLEEEMAEFRSSRDSPEQLASELGDLLFILAKLAQDQNVDAEAALRQAIDRIERRFRWVEQRARETGTEMGNLDSNTLLAFWHEAKSREKA